MVSVRGGGILFCYVVWNVKGECLLVYMKSICNQKIKSFNVFQFSFSVFHAFLSVSFIFFIFFDSSILFF